MAEPGAACRTSICRSRASAAPSWTRWPRRASTSLPWTCAEPARLGNSADAAASDFITRDAYTGATVNAFVGAALATDPILVDWQSEHQFNAFRPAQLQAPVLLVHGDRDPQVPLAAETKLFTRFGTPDKAWVGLPGADHAAHLEKSQSELVRTIVWFIRRHEV